ncbi:MAG: PAS domain-containing protein, partial [Pseudomonadota bacterium]
ELRYQQVNDCLAALNGCPPEDHIGRRVAEVVPMIADELEPMLRTVLKTGKPIRDLELQLSVPGYGDGIRDLQVSYFPLFAGDNPRPIGINAVVVDATESKRMRELAAANEALQRFAYVASHDLRSPLRGIATLLGYVREEVAEVASPQVIEYVDLATSRAKRMQQLTDDILAFNRLDEKKLETETVAIVDVINEAISMIDVPKEFTIDVPETTT